MVKRFRAFALGGLMLALSGAPAWADCKVNQIAALPVTMKGMQPLVPVKINGVDAMMMADSGAFYSMLMPAIASEQNLPKQSLPFGFSVVGIGGAAQPFLTVVKTFTLANVPIKNVEFIVVPGSDENAVGLLGQNILGLADVEYDFAHGVIRLMKAQDCGRIAMVYWEPGKAFSALPIERPTAARTTATVGAGYVNDAKIHVQFDTGASTSMMTLSAAKKAGIKMDDPAVVPAGQSWGIGRRLVRTWIVPVSSFKVGDEEIRNTKIRVGDFDMSEADMLLGADFFQSHRVYVANSQHMLYFTYNGGPVFDLTAKAEEQDRLTGQTKDSTASIDDGPEPTDADGFSRRGAALASRREFARAIADFDRAVAMAPTAPRYLSERGMAHWANGKPDLAKADFDAALKLKPDDVETLVDRAEFRLRSGDKPGAVSDLTAAAAAAPKADAVRLRLSSLFEGAGQLDAAIGQLDLWIPAHSDEAKTGQALNDRCWNRALLGKDLDLALKDCDRAVRLRPGVGSVLDSRGLVRLRLGQNEKAISDYDAALKLDPRIAWSLYGRGLAKQRLGQKAEGQADLDAALAISPGIAKLAAGYGIAGADAK